MMDLKDGDNFIEIKSTSIILWGIDIKPFEVNLTENINNYIENLKIPINEICEIVEDDIVGLYKLCLKTRTEA